MMLPAAAATRAGNGGVTAAVTATATTMATAAGVGGLVGVGEGRRGHRATWCTPVAASVGCLPVLSWGGGGRGG